MAFHVKAVLSTDQELLDYFISFLKELRYELPTFFNDCDVFIDSDGLGSDCVCAFLIKQYGLVDTDTVVWYFNDTSSRIRLWDPGSSRTMLGGIDKDVWRISPLIRLMVAAGILHNNDHERLEGILNTASSDLAAKEYVADSVRTISVYTGVSEEDLKVFIEQRKV